MRVAIVFDTHTASPRQRPRRWPRWSARPVTSARRTSTWSADSAAVARADAIVIGAWTKGWFIVRQHPSEGALTFLEKASFNGKPAAVFATYKLAVGSTVTQLARRRAGRWPGHWHVQGQGAQRPLGLRGLGRLLTGLTCCRGASPSSSLARRHQSLAA